ncbi:hypothetical protein ACFX4I_09250 [Peribacillus sp. YIM B13472]|uniref:hypothetical protein n=1 Tax=Peribacillus sp. YIM B13472 TaxID=3366297 RepID=UPI003670AA22
MNERLMEFLLRDEVTRLSGVKKQVYEFIVNEEDYLASKADTVDQFMRLLVKHSPPRLAARHFNMPYGEIIRFMNEIEDELNERLEERYKKVKWMDYTEKDQKAFVEYHRKLYLFVN